MQRWVWNIVLELHRFRSTFQNILITRSNVSRNTETSFESIFNISRITETCSNQVSNVSTDTENITDEDFTFHRISTFQKIRRERSQNACLAKNSIQTDLGVPRPRFSARPTCDDDGHAFLQHPDQFQWLGRQC